MDKETLGKKFAVIITQGIGTMTAALLFTILTLISLPSAIATHNAVVIVGWVAQTFLQLVLLPIIILGQNVQSEKSEKMIQDTHEVVLKEFALLNEELQLLKAKG